MGDLLKLFKIPERSKREITTGSGSETYPDVEQTIPGGKKPDIPGYSLEEVIFESSSSRIWRGKRQSDGLLVLIKGPASSEQSELSIPIFPAPLIACSTTSAALPREREIFPRWDQSTRTH